MGNEEEQAEEIEEVKKNEDFKGKIHYRLESDFTTQELKVTVRNLEKHSCMLRSRRRRQLRLCAAATFPVTW